MQPPLNIIITSDTSTPTANAISNASYASSTISSYGSKNACAFSLNILTRFGPAQLLPRASHFAYVNAVSIVAFNFFRATSAFSIFVRICPEICLRAKISASIPFSAAATISSVNAPFPDDTDADTPGCFVACSIAAAVNAFCSSSAACIWAICWAFCCCISYCICCICACICCNCALLCAAACCAAICWAAISACCTLLFAFDTNCAEINSIKSSPYFLHVALLFTHPATIGRAKSNELQPAHFGWAQRKINELQFPKSAVAPAPPPDANVRLFII